MRNFNNCNAARRSTWVLVLGLLFISTVGVRCFAIAENNKDKIRAYPTMAPIPTIGEPSLNRRSRILGSRLFAKEDQAPDPDSQDHAMNTTGSDWMAPAPISSLEHSTNTTQLSSWPCFDKLDRELIRISLPVIGNYAINPLIGAVDLFWVNRMGNALAVAGQAAANQVFSSAFWFTSFLPSGKESIDVNLDIEIIWIGCLTHCNLVTHSYCNTGLQATRKWKQERDERRNLSSSFCWVLYRLDRNSSHVFEP